MRCVEGEGGGGDVITDVAPSHSAGSTVRFGQGQ